MVLAVSIIGETYVRMAGLLECAKTSKLKSGDFDVVDGAGGARSDRSSMKLPAARLLGVRGRWRIKEMS